MEWRVHQIHRSYTSGRTTIHALRGVDAWIPHKTICCIQGPSGAGKSTLLRILGLLDSQFTGELYLDGKPWEAWNGTMLRQLKNAGLGFIFQEYALLEEETVFENIRLPLDLAGVAYRDQRSRVYEVLETLQLGERMDASVQALSGGQRQRVSIARALVNHPRALLADEAWNSLDPALSHSILSWILAQSWCENLVFVTHQSLPDTPAWPVLRIYLEEGEVRLRSPYITPHSCCNKLEPT